MDEIPNVTNPLPPNESPISSTKVRAIQPVRLVIAIVLLLVLMGMCVFLYFASAPSSLTPRALTAADGASLVDASGTLAGSTMVTLEKGQSVGSVSRELESLGIVRSAVLLQSAIVLLGGEHRIVSGIYKFQAPQNVFTVARRVIQGDVGYTAVRITLPEGSTVKDMSAIISKALPYISKDTFIQKATPKEGYLFPDTYLVMPFSNEDQLIERFSKNFDRRVAPLSQSFASSTHSYKDIITMASVLEEEVLTAEDRAIVADIFWRRIAMGMALQADSTLRYETGKGSADLLLTDLRKDSPYNSYTNRGLPPTPISNPGIETIKAALNPKPNTYLYFLSDKNGITHFAKTFEEHKRNKALYLK